MSRIPSRTALLTLLALGLFLSGAACKDSDSSSVPPSPPGVLQFGFATFGANEDGGSVTVFVTRTDGGGGEVTVDYATSDGTATAGADYGATAGTLTWPHGVTADRTFIIPITDDGLIEGTETVNLALTLPTGGASLGTQGTAILAIYDDDTPGPGALQLDAATYSGGEAGGSVTVTVTRTGGVNSAITVDYATSDGTATAGSDYTAASGQLAWAAGDGTVKTFSVDILDDGLPEGDETLDLSLSNPGGGASLGTQSTAVLTIVDDDVPGTLRFTSTDFQVSESGGLSTTITVVRTGGSGGAVAVDYATSDGTATAGSDYTAASGQLTWADGDTGSKTISVSITDDFIVEGDETVDVTLSNPTGGATVGSPGSAILTIVEDDVPGTLQLQVAAYTVDENGGAATITVTRTGGSGNAVTVDYATSDGTANAGADYTAASGQLAWTAGDTSDKSFIVAIIDDASVEGDETVNLTLSNPTGGATVGVPGSGVLTIQDDEVPGSLQLSAATYTVDETGGTATITVTRAGGSGGAVTVDYATSDLTATAGADYTAASGTLSWTAGDAGDKAFFVTITDDALVEGDETVSITLTNPTGGATLGTPTGGVLTIVDDEVPGSLQLSSASHAVDEGGGTATITVTRTGGSGGAVGVDYATSDGSATAGNDYTATSGSLGWAAGDAAPKTFTVAIIDDAGVEGDETLDITLANPTGGAALGSPSTGVLTIIDDDVPGTIQLFAAAATVSEAEGMITITARRTGGTGGAVSVDYATSNGTASAGSDYMATSGQLIWSGGDGADKSFAVSIMDDSLIEPDETLNIALTNPTGGAILGVPSTAVLTIRDNDQPGTVRFTSAAFTTPEGATTGVVTAIRTGGSGGAVTVDYATSDGTATAGSDYTAASGQLAWADGENGERSFTLSVADDDDIETDETINVALSNVTGGATLGTPSSGTLTIVDDDWPGTLELASSDFEVGEAGGTATITLTRTWGVGGAVSVDYATSDGTATAGADYAAASGTLNWPAGDNSDRTFVVPITDDAIVEGDLTVDLVLSNPTGGASLGSQATAVLTIFEDDAAGSLQFEISTFESCERDTQIDLYVSRIQGTLGAVSVNFDTIPGTASSGSDYGGASGTVSWGDGDRGIRSVSVLVLNDLEEEGDETFAVALSSPTGGASLGTPDSVLITIPGNDLLRGGVIRSWGDQYWYELGQAGWDPDTDPGRVADSRTPCGYLEGVVAVQASDTHNLALIDDGTVMSWGSNWDGQLGDRTTTDRETPVQVIDPADPTGYLTRVIQIATGTGYEEPFSAALLDDGTVRTWGENSGGQLGDGTFEYRVSPVQVVDPTDPTGFLTDVTAIALGEHHTLAVLWDGTVRLWGVGKEFGVPEDTRSVPVQIKDPADPTGFLTGIISVAAGEWSCAALKDDGTVRTWGRNYGGQLGDGGYQDSSTPVQVVDPDDPTGYLNGVAAIEAGAAHCLALLADGTVRAWGGSWWGGGALGDGTNEGSPIPVQVINPLDPTGLLRGVVAVSAQSHSMALRGDGTVWVWGDDFSLNLTPTQATDSQDPSGYLMGVTAIAVGERHFLAVQR